MASFEVKQSEVTVTLTLNGVEARMIWTLIGNSSGPNPEGVSPGFYSDLTAALKPHGLNVEVPNAGNGTRFAKEV